MLPPLGDLHRWDAARRLVAQRDGTDTRCAPGFGEAMPRFAAIVLDETCDVKHQSPYEWARRSSQPQMLLDAERRIGMNRRSIR